MASYKDYLKKPDFINVPKDVKPSTPVETTQTPKESKPSQYKPQRYNKKTGQVEDIKAGQTTTRKEVINQTTANGQLSREQQLKADFEQSQADKAYIASLTPDVVSQEQISQVGDPILSGLGATPRDTLQEQAILENQATSKLVSKVPIVNVAGKLFGGGIKFLNKQAGGSGNAVLEKVNSIPALKAYLNDYSNESSFTKVQGDIIKAKQSIADAKDLATEGNVDIAIETYNTAVSELRQAERKLKLLEGDQKDYVDNVKAARTELLNELIRVEKYHNVEMQNALNGLNQ